MKVSFNIHFIIKEDKTLTGVQRDENYDVKEKEEFLVFPNAKFYH